MFLLRFKQLLTIKLLLFNYFLFSLVSNFSNFNAIIRYLQILFYKCGKTTTVKRKPNGNTIYREQRKTATKRFSLLRGI